MAKSDSYQYRIVEIPLEPHKLHNFANESGIHQHMTDMLIDDEILELKANILEEIYNIINSGSLTAHQKKVLTMCLSGATQNEIAEKLGITQSAVHKAMHGNIDYKNNKKRYGGIIKKLQKLSKNNPRIKFLLDQIERHKKNNVEEETQE
jgi:DNA-binding CsgD family transcriptional regulator